MAWGWEHAGELAAMTNPAGYLFRVGQSAARRYRKFDRHRVAFLVEKAWNDPDLAGDVFDEYVASDRPSGSQCCWCTATGSVTATSLSCWRPARPR